MSKVAASLAGVVVILAGAMAGGRVAADPPGYRGLRSAAPPVSANDRAAWQVINSFIEQASADGVITADESRAILNVTYQQLPEAEASVRNRLRPLPQPHPSVVPVPDDTELPTERYSRELPGSPPFGEADRQPAPPPTSMRRNVIAATPTGNRGSIQVMLGRPTPISNSPDASGSAVPPTRMPDQPAGRFSPWPETPNLVQPSPMPHRRESLTPLSTVPAPWDSSASLPPDFPSEPADSCSGAGWTGNDDGEYDGLGRNSYWFGALEAYRGEPDCRWPANFGARLGTNMSVPLWASEGIGGQFGLSYGTFDWHGRGSTTSDNAGWAEELIWSVGVFHRARSSDLDCGLPLSWGLAYDWMLTDNFGLDSNELLLGQWRGQVEYALSACDALGVAASLHDNGDGQGNFIIGHSDLDPLDQINVFWRHKLESAADFRVWVGAAEDPGEFSFGGELNIPLSCHFAAFMAAHYIKPSASGGDGDGWHDEYYMLTAGINYFPGGTAISGSVLGRRWMPYLPMPDNGSFAVKTSDAK